MDVPRNAAHVGGTSVQPSLLIVVLTLLWCLPFYGESFMKTYIAFLAAALVSTVAFAQQEPKDPPASTNAATTPPPASASPGLSQIFDQLDANHDGKLSQEEAQAAPTVSTNFAAADRDHDGTVSKEEFLAAFKAGPQ
jgi:hypothetical protein